MRRRQALVGIAGLLAGCGSGEPTTDQPTTTRTTTDQPTVAGEVVVEAWRGAGLSPVRGQTVRLEPGTLTYRVACRDDTETVETRSLPDAEYRALVEQVASVRDGMGTWAERYECTGICAADDGWRSLDVMIGDRQFETAYDPLADPPDGASALHEHVFGYNERFDADTTAICARTTTEPADGTNRTTEPADGTNRTTGSTDRATVESADGATRTTER